MSESHPAGLIAIDGGGTNCRICLVVDDRRSEIRIGSTNVSTDLAAAIETIRLGLEAVAKKAGIEMEELSHYPAYVGLAGLMGPAMAQRVAKNLPLINLIVEDDRKIAVVGALGTDDGVVAGIGTGSFLARQSQGVIQFIGGYGPQLGDEASGASLGRALLARTLLVKDGLESRSPLTEMIFSEFDNDANHIVEFGQTAAPINYARYAPRVVETAKAGDSVSLTLMQSGADYIVRGINILGWCPGETLCLIGGVAPHYQSYLPPVLSAAITPPKSSALDGALALAARINNPS
jgi:glucosamine kinase